MRGGAGCLVGRPFCNLPMKKAPCGAFVQVRLAEPESYESPGEKCHQLAYTPHLPTKKAALKAPSKVALIAVSSLLGSLREQ